MVEANTTEARKLSAARLIKSMGAMYTIGEFIGFKEVQFL